MINACPNDRRLPTPRPSAFEWRDQREACFIFKCQPSVQFANLFLSLATCPPSKPRLLHHPCVVGGVVVAGCSSPADPARAKPRWDGNAPQTIARGPALSCPTSSNRLHTQKSMRLDPALFPVVETVSPIISAVFLEDELSFFAFAFWLLVASDIHNEVLPSVFPQLLSAFSLPPAWTALDCLLLPTARLFLSVSYRHSGTI